MVFNFFNPVAYLGLKKGTDKVPSKAISDLF